MSSDPSYDLHKIFLGQQEVLLAQLNAIRESAGHSVTTGNGTEAGWREVIQQFLPFRYQVSHGFVVDSLGNRSEQIDVIIHDRQYSPLLWKVEEDYYIPAESVYAVFEVKQDLDLDNVKYAANKAASVRRRHRTQGDFAWMGGKGKQELNFILAGLLTSKSKWADPFGEPLKKAVSNLVLNETLNLGCVLESGAWELGDVGGSFDLNHSTAEASLISFLMILIQRLQSMRTVGGIDYEAYQREGEIDS